MNAASMIINSIPIETGSKSSRGMDSKPVEQQPEASFISVLGKLENEQRTKSSTCGKDGQCEKPAEDVESTPVPGFEAGTSKTGKCDPAGEESEDKTDVETDEACLVEEISKIAAGITGIPLKEITAIIKAMDIDMHAVDFEALEQLAKHISSMAGNVDLQETIKKLEGILPAFSAEEESAGVPRQPFNEINMDSLHAAEEKEIPAQEMDIASTAGEDSPGFNGGNKNLEGETGGYQASQNLEQADNGEEVNYSSTGDKEFKMALKQDGEKPAKVSPPDNEPQIADEPEIVIKSLSKDNFNKAAGVEEASQSVFDSQTGISDDAVHSERIYETRTGADMPKEEILKQVVDKASVVIDGDKSEMLMELKPDSLGKLSLKIVTERGMVMAKFVAENQQVKEIIESNMQILKDALSKQGVSVQGLSVSVGNEQHGARNGQQGLARRGTRRPGGLRNTPVYSTEASLDSGSKNPYLRLGGSIDLSA